MSHSVKAQKYYCDHSFQIRGLCFKKWTRQGNASKFAIFFFREIIFTKKFRENDFTKFIFKFFFAAIDDEVENINMAFPTPAKIARDETGITV